MKILWYYVRTRNSAGKLLRDHFKTKSKKRAQLYINMFPTAQMEEVYEGTDKPIVPWEG